MSCTRKLALLFILVLGGALAVGCPPTGPAEPLGGGHGSSADRDTDGVLDDGSGDNIPGDHPCSGGHIARCDDNCPLTINPGQEDRDQDGVGDVCDNCPDTPNADQRDDDNDHVGNACQHVDTDHDGILDDGNGDSVVGGVGRCTGGATTNCDDNCIATPNSNQVDQDSDLVGDACDNCPNTPNADQHNNDGDLKGDACDDCPNDPNKFEPGACGCGIPDIDSDGDGTLNCNDACPNDPSKAASAGICGCGHPDIDSDGDGVLNCNDACPNDPLKSESTGQCGCGNPDTDNDGDGVANCHDACPNDPLKSGSTGQCGCSNPDTDSDGDGTANCHDNCPNNPGKINAGQCGCAVPDTDNDEDGTANCNDVCPNDPAKTVSSGVCGCGVADTDSDGDGTPNCNDGCPNDPAKTSAGTCGCGHPDTDTDGDGAVCIDNCPTVPNPGQQDADGDGVGDACDNCPHFSGSTSQLDSNNNGFGDVCERYVTYTFTVHASTPGQHVDAFAYYVIDHQHNSQIYSCEKKGALVAADTQMDCNPFPDPAATNDNGELQVGITCIDNTPNGGTPMPIISDNFVFDEMTFVYRFDDFGGGPADCSAMQIGAGNTEFLDENNNDLNPTFSCDVTRNASTPPVCP